jgi:hypothetical protein
LITTGAATVGDGFGVVGSAVGAVVAGVEATGVDATGADGTGPEATVGACTAAGGLVATLPTAGLKAAIAIVAPITQIIVGKFLNIANP